MRKEHFEAIRRDCPWMIDHADYAAACTLAIRTSDTKWLEKLSCWGREMSPLVEPEPDRHPPVDIPTLEELRRWIKRE